MFPSAIFSNSAELTSSSRGNDYALPWHLLSELE
jgi:hypothetical protein